MLHGERLGSGPPVVLIHGFTQTGESWETVASSLALDHEVLAVDLPGHGRSGAACDLRSSAAAVLTAGGTADYIGYSLGGRIALYAALTHPNQVKRLVLVSSTAGLDSAADRDSRRQSDEELARILERDGVDSFLAMWLALPLFCGVPADAPGLAARHRNTATGLAASLRLAGTGTMDPPLWDRLYELAMPVLIVAGENDQKFLGLAERLADTVGSNASLAVIPAAGHAVHLEQPGLFLNEVHPFLSSAGDSEASSEQ